MCFTPNFSSIFELNNATFGKEQAPRKVPTENSSRMGSSVCKEIKQKQSAAGSEIPLELFTELVNYVNVNKTRPIHTEDWRCVWNMKHDPGSKKIATPVIFSWETQNVCIFFVPFRQDPNQIRTKMFDTSGCALSRSGVSSGIHVWKILVRPRNAHLYSSYDDLNFMSVWRPRIGVVVRGPETELAGPSVLNRHGWAFLDHEGAIHATSVHQTCENFVIDMGDVITLVINCHAGQVIIGKEGRAVLLTNYLNTSDSLLYHAAVSSRLQDFVMTDYFACE